MKKKLLIAAGTLFSFAGVAQSYIPVQVSGYNADVVANGSGAASASTTNDVDGGGFAFVAGNFINPSGQSPSSSLPNSGTIQTAVSATPGLTFQLASYTGNNALRISGGGSGTLSVNTPVAADQVYILATSGSGVSAVTITIYFSDGTSQAFTQTIADWFGGSNFAIQGISRVNINNNGIENNAANPRLYQYLLSLSAANAGKQIQSIEFNKTSSSGVLNVMGVSVRSVASTLANDVGIISITSPESGCGLSSTENVSVRIHNYGSDSQTNIPVSYTVNGGTPVIENFAGPLPSNTSAVFTFATPADLSAVGTYAFDVFTALSSDTVAGNNARNKTVVVSQAPATPVLTVTGPTSFCAGNFVTLSASSSTGATFYWMQGGNQIPGATGAIYAAGTSGNYSVKAIANGCTSLASAPVSLTSIPAPAAPFISTNQSTAFCSGESVTLTAASQNSGATFQWLHNGTTLPGQSGATLTTTESGTYKAIATSGGCASTQSNALNVFVSPTPVTPAITQNGTMLTSSSGVGNQWYKDGNIIPGATGSTYNVTESGDYSVIVTQDDCSSDLSNILSVVISGVQNSLAEKPADVFPNPSNGLFTVKLHTEGPALVTVTDITGKFVKQQFLTVGENQLHLTNVPNGMYVLQITSPQGVATSKVVIE